MATEYKFEEEGSIIITMKTKPEDRMLNQERQMVVA